MRPLLACLAAALTAGLIPAAGPSPVRDPAGLFKPETIDAVRAVVAPLEDRRPVQVRVVTLKDAPAAPPESRTAALERIARDEPSGDDDLLLILACPQWKLVKVFAAPASFAQRVNPAARDAMEQAFAGLFDAPDAVLPTAVDTACRELVALYHPNLTILDRARLFSPAGIDKAATELAAYEGPYDTRLVIQTVPTLRDLDPALTGEQLRKLSTRDTLRRLTDLACRQADLLKSQGLFNHAAYALIVNDPPSVTVINWPAAFEGDLSRFQRGEVRNTFGRRRADRPDESLFIAVKQFKEFQEEQRPIHSPLSAAQALALLGVLVGAWLLLRVVRRRLAGPDRPRLYTPALMGSLFGVPAGAWVYDQLFEAERPPAPAADAAAPGPATDEAADSSLFPPEPSPEEGPPEAAEPQPAPGVREPT